MEKNQDPRSGINIPDPLHWIRDGKKSGSEIRDKHPGSAALLYYANT
jgi:hypothetical protein